MTDDALIRDAEVAARALLDRRIELIRELATSAAELEPLLKAAAEGEQRALKAWADVLAGGWTPDELRKLGYREPDKRPGAKKAGPKRAGGATPVAGRADVGTGTGEAGGSAGPDESDAAAVSRGAADVADAVDDAHLAEAGAECMPEGLLGADGAPTPGAGGGADVHAGVDSGVGPGGEGALDPSAAARPGASPVPQPGPRSGPKAGVTPAVGPGAQPSAPAAETIERSADRPDAAPAEAAVAR
ncbi:hypothetical protein ACIRL2_32070 [Embleya sp. NPDC127516]|uniref:hypothetical protein n=1 Tax=Embleya sp. NPDC127516 TaxID=3363990 RepID=UPI003800D0EF